MDCEDADDMVATKPKRANVRPKLFRHRLQQCLRCGPLMQQTRLSFELLVLLVRWRCVLDACQVEGWVWCTVSERYFRKYLICSCCCEAMNSYDTAVQVTTDGCMSCCMSCVCVCVCVCLCVCGCDKTGGCTSASYQPAYQPSLARWHALALSGH
jgi:hypothetical protein